MKSKITYYDWIPYFKAVAFKMLEISKDKDNRNNIGCDALSAAQYKCGIGCFLASAGLRQNLEEFRGESHQQKAEDKR